MMMNKLTKGLVLKVNLTGIKVVVYVILVIKWEPNYNLVYHSGSYWVEVITDMS